MELPILFNPRHNFPDLAEQRLEQPECRASVGERSSREAGDVGKPSQDGFCRSSSALDSESTWDGLPMGVVLEETSWGNGYIFSSGGAVAEGFLFRSPLHVYSAVRLRLNDIKVIGL